MWTGSGAYLGISVVSNQVVGLTVLTYADPGMHEKRGSPFTFGEQFSKYDKSV